MRSSLILMAVLTLGTAACTFFSGVEELELRQGPPPSSSTSSTSDTSPTGDGGGFILPDGSFNPFGSLGGGGSSSGSTGGGGDAGTTTIIGKPGSPGPVVCGATGTWSACELPVTVTSCALECQAKGLSCVE